jgi:oligoribonuclease
MTVHKDKKPGGSKKGRMVWLDMEMSGLEPETDRILEIATIVTDRALEIIAVGPVIAVHQDDAALAAMDDWNTQHHGDSGLTDRVKRSTVSDREAERETIQFLADHVKRGHAPLCGNSIGQDRRFIYKYMPDLSAFLHYRSVDVSTIKELAKRWYPDLAEFEKVKAHTALEDIKESIEELKYYREKIFVPIGTI